VISLPEIHDPQFARPTLDVSPVHPRIHPEDTGRSHLAEGEVGRAADRGLGPRRSVDGEAGAFRGVVGGREGPAVVPALEPLAGQGQRGLGLFPPLGSIPLGPRGLRALDLLRGGRDLLHRGLVAACGRERRG